MRRTYISPEFQYKKVYGTFNMMEHSSFFGSKMLEIDDSISIKNDTIIYYQLDNGEQLDAASEERLTTELSPIIYNAVVNKSNNHKLMIDDSQSDSDKDGKARWILDIQIQSILRDYIFASMKKYRTFESVTNNMTVNNSVNAAMKEYIDKNVLSRYKFTKVEFFIQSVDLLTIGGLKYGNKYDSTIESPSTIYTKFQSDTDANDLDIRLTFYQDKPASQYAFNYYFNLYFEKL
jgi:hypothetical protein